MAAVAAGRGTAAWLTIVGIGVLAGGVSGLLGVGGGVLIVPALVLLNRFMQRRAHATSLAATFLMSLSGVAGFATAGQVDWAVSALLVTGSVAGAWVGTGVLHRIDQDVLRIGFAVLLLLAAARMLVDIPEGGQPLDITVANALALVVLGFFVGALAGLMGVGGGIVIVPVQILLFGISGPLAKGTSLAMIVPTAAGGTVRNLRNHLVDLPGALVLGLSGVITAFIGSQVALDLDPTLSAILFATLLFAAAARLLLTRRSSVSPVPEEVVGVPPAGGTNP